MPLTPAPAPPPRTRRRAVLQPRASAIAGAVAWTVAATLAAACGGRAPTEGGAPRGIALSRERLAGVTLALAASSTAVAPGDAVTFTVSIANATAERVQVGGQCGPPDDVVVTPPRGPSVSVLAALLGGNGAFTCELGPQHFVGARETRTSTLAWRAPAERGTYEARAGLRRGDGLGNLSAPVRITVR